MSSVNIKRAVENIRSKATTVYTPLVEVIVNAIQAIEEGGDQNAEIKVFAIRSQQSELDGSLPEVRSFRVEDAGIGFTEENRSSFDILYSDQKIGVGGKGFGRFTSLRYFNDVHYDSIYQAEGQNLRRRTFSMGKDTEIIESEKVEETNQKHTRTVVHLDTLKDKVTIEKKLKTIARNLIEKLLPFFIIEEQPCPRITLCEENGEFEICLNDFLHNALSREIVELDIENRDFSIKSRNGVEDFRVRLFKFFAPKGRKSKISLVAHRREVDGSAIDQYVPEFVEEFYEKGTDEEPSRNFILRAYVFGEYLDRHVSLERGGFEFQKESDLHYGIGQNEIESKAASIAGDAMGDEVPQRQEKKRERIQSFVDEQAPWHKTLIQEIDLSDFPYRATPQELENRLQKAKYTRESKLRGEVTKLLNDASAETLERDVGKIVSKISQSSQNDLTHYIALRRCVLDLFAKSLDLRKDGKYPIEGAVHDIIFPRKGDTDTTAFDQHNLWIIDERQNFTQYIASDIPVDGGTSERPDLLAFDKRILFRGDNEPSNPITIFEFKRPGRDDFVNASSKEDPVQQIIRYVNDIQDGKFKTPEGRPIRVGENTAFYGYVVCDLTAKIERWLDREKDFTPMPDGLGWFERKGNINLYIEVLSWDKVLKDAKMRNQIFFHKLGI